MTRVADAVGSCAGFERPVGRHGDRLGRREALTVDPVGVAGISVVNLAAKISCGGAELSTRCELKWTCWLPGRGDGDWTRWSRRRVAGGGEGVVAGEAVRATRVDATVGTLTGQIAVRLDATGEVDLYGARGALLMPFVMCMENVDPVVVAVP